MKTKIKDLLKMAINTVNSRGEEFATEDEMMETVGQDEIMELDQAIENCFSRDSEQLADLNWDDLDAAVEDLLSKI